MIALVLGLRSRAGIAFTALVIIVGALTSSGTAVADLGEADQDDPSLYTLDVSGWEFDDLIICRVRLIGYDDDWRKRNVPYNLTLRVTIYLEQRVSAYSGGRVRYPELVGLQVTPTAQWVEYEHVADASASVLDRVGLMLFEHPGRDKLKVFFEYPPLWEKSGWSHTFECQDLPWKN